MIRHEIAAWLAAAAKKAQEDGTIPAFTEQDVVVERPANPENGDYASSIALKLARSARKPPIVLAKALADLIRPDASIQRIDVAPPGFLNFHVSEDWLRQQMVDVVDQGERYGQLDLVAGESVLVEFVSANPTGPLTAATGRAASIGEALANVLEAVGYKVTREYYLNDSGSRMDAFNRTAYARYCQHFGLEVDLPPDGYGGLYMQDLARQIADAEGNRFLSMPNDAAVVAVGGRAFELVVESIKATLTRIGVSYERWFSEQSLYDDGEVLATIEQLDRRGYVTQREGASWFASSRLDDDKDHVLVRSNGTPTYLAADIAYHVDKLVKRRFDRAIDIWGGDHQGHVHRMKSALSALEIDPGRLDIVVHQMITLRRGNEIVRMSKRTGDLVTLDEVIDEVGSDACRFYFLSRSIGSQMEFDLELAKAQSNDNPVYYVQYAHARISSILRNAGDVGLDPRNADLNLLSDPSELQLIRKLLALPEVIELAANNLEPHHLPHYSQELATAFHWFYTQCRVISDDSDLTAARLTLCLASKVALARTLQLMGMSAPDQM
jgi:arginyl-tRNA synthetase